MFKLISRILQSRGFAIFLKVLASLASAIFVINGYFILTNKKAQEDDLEDEEGLNDTEEIGKVEAPELPEDDIDTVKKKSNIHLFRRRRK